MAQQVHAPASYTKSNNLPCVSAFCRFKIKAQAMPVSRCGKRHPQCAAPYIFMPGSASAGICRKSSSLNLKAYPKIKYLL